MLIQGQLRNSVYRTLGEEAEIGEFRSEKQIVKLLS